MKTSMVSRPAIVGLVEITLPRFEDERGFFIERYRRSVFQKLGVATDFDQINHSRSVANVLRGLHFQHSPGQGKLVGVASGRIWDVALDLRRESPTWGKWHGVELSDRNRKTIWIPPGFAHGFCVIGDQPADVFYLTTSEYAADREDGLRWDDPDLGISWPLHQPNISERDQRLKSWREHSRAPEPRWIV